MPNSVAIFDAHMNITIHTKPNENFYCSECGWKGLATELDAINGFSCCPQCLDIDVRVDLDSTNET